MNVWLNFTSLCDKVATWKDETLLDDITVEGQLMHLRRISRKCSFFDLASLAMGPDGQRERLEVVLKIIDDELSLEEVDGLRRRIKPGDIVQIRGFVERLKGGMSILLHARDINVIQAWKDKHPGVTFLPLPTVVIDNDNKCRSVAEGLTDKTFDLVLHQNGSEQTATGAKGQRIHCKFWINSKTCQQGNNCDFFHVSDVERKTEYVKWLNERLLLKRVRAHIEEDPLDPHGKVGKQQRAQVFVEWLVQTFGSELLAAGKGVVDVAGGRGSVAFELWNKRKLPCTLIEPRPIKLSKLQHKHMKKLQQANEQSDEGYPTESLVPQVMALFNTDTFLEKTEHVQLVEQASLIIGMHPDEATEAILDAAIKFSKPFAVVPCCVFGQKFPHRRLADGSKVLSYKNLIEYLIAKHPNIEKAFLPFDGKNLVLFRRPESCNKQD
ncbi:hypothetical protein PsorP6_008980 [Peronosclerospora sorghi]|uniref:Uncharacterized protein n=1 Tax=Peronosclerospora sorghi TaxID=230839 RepID=A0ACC0W054_9STRA|nr:hypothetical protein PsorP6_008980 [Peronosclerospora sorghi]